MASNLVDSKSSTSYSSPSLANYRQTRYSYKNQIDEIGDWYWLIDEKDNLVKICKNLSDFDTKPSPRDQHSEQTTDSTLPNKPKRIFDFFEGEETKTIYKNIHSILRSGKKKKIAFVWRCDSSTMCNHMYMVISLSPQNKSHILYHSLLLRSYPQNIPFLANFGTEDRPSSVSVCGFCFRVQTSGSTETFSCNEYYYQGGTDNVNTLRFVCETCRASFVEFLKPLEIKVSVSTMVAAAETLKTIVEDINEFNTEQDTSSQNKNPDNVPESSPSDPPKLDNDKQKSETNALIKRNSDNKRLSPKPSVLPKSLDFGCLNILFVDDSRLNQSILGRMMKRAGMQISLASSGADAVSLTRDKIDNGYPFDIILMDCVMPGELDGYAATSKIREFSKVPIIAATGLPKDTWETSYKPAGMNDYLPKPFNMKDVLVLLRKWAPRSS